MFRKLDPKRTSRNIQGSVDPREEKINNSIAITDLIIRQYTKDEFDEAVWRLKWENFIHPHTKESGSEYLERMKDEPNLNPELQKNAPFLILVEPLYGIRK